MDIKPGAVHKLTFESVRVRAVSVPLRRPLVQRFWSIDMHDAGIYTLLYVASATIQSVSLQHRAAGIARADGFLRPGT